MTGIKNRRIIMDKDEMNKFIENIGRTELYDEIHNSNGYPRYIKAVRASLIALGYDEEWVDSEFRNAIEKRYLGISSFKRR